MMRNKTSYGITDVVEALEESLGRPVTPQEVPVLLSGRVQLSENPKEECTLRAAAEKFFGTKKRFLVLNPWV